MPEELNFYQYRCDKPNFTVRCLLWQPTSIGLSVMNVELHVINTFQTHIAFKSPSDCWAICRLIPEHKRTK